MRNRFAVWFGMALAVCAAFGSPGHAAEPKRGDPAPTHLGKNRDGDPVDLTRYRGKVVVVTFWASWCGACRKELPVLDALQKFAGDKFLNIVAVNVEDSASDYRQMMRQMKGYTIGLVRDHDGKIAERYGVKAYPNLWIIDPEGKVANHHVGYGEDSITRIIDDINRVLRDHAVPATPAAVAAPTAG